MKFLSRTCRAYSSLDRATTSSSPSSFSLFSFDWLLLSVLASCEEEEEEDVVEEVKLEGEVEEKRSMMESKVRRAQDSPSRASEYAPLTYGTYRITIIQHRLVIQTVKYVIHTLYISKNKV